MIRSQKELAEVQQPTQSLTQSDKMLLRYEDSRDWFAHNQKFVIGGAVAIVAIIAGLWWWAGQKQTQEEQAATYVSRILPVYLQGQYRLAIDGDTHRKIQGEPVYGLRYIVNEYGSTEAGSRAALALANSYYSLGQYDSAAQYYDDASSDYPIGKAAIEAGKAAISEHKGNKQEAAKLFESAAKRDKDNPLDADYTLSAARDRQAAGDRDEAIRLYRTLLENFPGSQFDDAAKRALMQMNVPL
jgi:tetratricopeptide (TPR) repeat protein